MKRFLYILALVLLLINGIGAVYGGLSLMKDPTGELLQMPAKWLEYSPFKDFLIPGIILFVFNGLFSLTIFILALLRYKHYALLIIIQGATLFSWIVVQVIMLRTFYYLHAIFGGMGLLLILAGALLHREKLRKHSI